MALRREPFTLLLDENVICGRFPQLKVAAKAFSDRLARMDATWEPIDWSEF